MIGIQARFTDTSKRVEAAAEKANFRNLFHAAASVRKQTRESIERAPKNIASAAGSPPHTHRGQYLKRAVLFFVDAPRDEAIIGFSAARVGDVGAVHEFGERRGRAQYPKRPTLGPVLEHSASRLGDEWRGSIGG